MKPLTAILVSAAILALALAQCASIIVIRELRADVAALTLLLEPPHITL